METYSALKGFYETRDEDVRLTSRAGRVEFLTTMRYIEKYLEPGMRILEIGAGTGRYSHSLAQMGYEVDAVELMPCNIEAFNKKMQPGERIRVFEGNAMDLSFLTGEAYDIVLLLGPMYHLFEEKDKLRALSEAIRMAKPGSVIFAAYCCADASILQHGFMKGNIHNLIEAGMVHPETFRAHSDPKDVFELHRKEDIDALMKNFSVTRLHYVGTDMMAHFIRNTMEEMDEDTFGTYMKYHFTVCEREDMTGISNHVLDIFRKNKMHYE